MTILDENKTIGLACSLLLVLLVTSLPALAAPNESREQTKAAKCQLADTSHVDFSGEVPIVVAHLQTDGQQYEFKAPYFDPSEEPSPQELQTFARETVTKLVQPIQDIIESAMVKNRGRLSMLTQIGMAGLRYLFTFQSIRQQSRTLKRKYSLPVDERFADATMSIVPELIGKAEAELEAASGKSIASDKAQIAASGRGIILIMDGMKELVNNSPVGSHLRFREMTINGRSMIEEFVGHIKFMKKAGLGYLLDKMTAYCNKAAENNRKAIAEEASAQPA